LSDQIAEAQVEINRSRTALEVAEKKLEEESEKRQEAEGAVDEEARRRRSAEEALRHLQMQSLSSFRAS